MFKVLLKLWFPVLAWMGFIFTLSHVPDLKTDLKEDFLFRKIAHVTEYLILTFLLFRAFKGSFKPSPITLYLYPTLISFLYAASDEFHQTFVQGRSGTITDVWIDSIGILVFYGFLWMKTRIAP